MDVNDFMKIVLSELKDVRGDLSEIKSGMAAQHVVQGHQAKRMDDLYASQEATRDELVPLKKHINAWASAGKLLAGVTTLIGAIVGLVKLFG